MDTLDFTFKSRGAPGFSHCRRRQPSVSTSITREHSFLSIQKKKGRYSHSFSFSFYPIVTPLRGKEVRLIFWKYLRKTRELRHPLTRNQGNDNDARITKKLNRAIKNRMIFVDGWLLIMLLKRYNLSYRVLQCKKGLYFFQNCQAYNAV